MSVFLPMICLYHAVCENIFLNVSVKQATGIEALSNTLLTPFQYLFCGKEASLKEDGSWEISQKFNYSTSLGPKTLVSITALPFSLPFGALTKGLSLLSNKGKYHYTSLTSHFASTEIISNQPFYATLGIETGNLENAPFITSQNHLRRPLDELHLQKAKEALKEITQLLNQAQIPWWVDCGTLLGAYRYGGVIPWDNDIDIALLLPDFENARRAFNGLDPSKYVVQDWSGRDFPRTFFKIYLKETQDLIDIYFYEIDCKKKECAYIFSLEKSIVFFHWWKEGERRFTKPISLHSIFPLKKAMFDGMEVFVPNDPIPFLQRYYGENLAPARILDVLTNRFEKDLSHPYWQNPYVH